MVAMIALPILPSKEALEEPDNTVRSQNLLIFEAVLFLIVRGTKTVDSLLEG